MNFTVTMIKIQIWIWGTFWRISKSSHLWDELLMLFGVFVLWRFPQWKTLVSIALMWWMLFYCTCYLLKLICKFLSISVNAKNSIIESDEGPKKDTTPLWKYVTRLGGGRGGGTTKFTCLHCNKTYTGTYTRVRKHLCGIMPCNQGKATGVKTCDKVSAKERNKYRMD